MIAEGKRKREKIKRRGENNKEEKKKLETEKGGKAEEREGEKGKDKIWVLSHVFYLTLKVDLHQAN